MVRSASGKDPNLVLEDVKIWVETAIEEIKTKRKEMVDHLTLIQVPLFTVHFRSFVKLSLYQKLMLFFLKGRWVKYLPYGEERESTIILN